MGKQSKKSMPKVTAILLAIMMVVVFMPTFAFAADSAPANPIKVHVTVSDKGDIAVDKDNAPVTWLPVTASDINKDGKITYDEAMIALHDEYFKGGAEAGFGVTDQGWVTKLWGVENNPASYSFLRNDRAFSEVVTKQEIEQDDFLEASINSDAECYADWASWFDSNGVVTKVGDSVQFKLEGYQAMTQNDPAPAKDIQIGFFVNGKFVPLETEAGPVKTNDAGMVTLEMVDAGEYILTAKGTVKDDVTVYEPPTYEPREIKDHDCPLIAPVCLITVEKADSKMTVKANMVTAKAKKNTTIAAKKAFTVKNNAGKVTFKQKTKNAKIKVATNGKVTVKKGLKKGKTYKIKVDVTDKGNENYNKVTYTRTLKVKIK